MKPSRLVLHGTRQVEAMFAHDVAVGESGKKTRVDRHRRPARVRLRRQRAHQVDLADLEDVSKLRHVLPGNPIAFGSGGHRLAQRDRGRRKNIMLLGTPEADLEKAIKARLNELDDLFFEVLTQNLQAAQQSDPEAFAQLQKIGDAAMRAIQGTQPPEVRFVNTLLQVEYPNQTRELLERNKQVLGPEFIAWMEGLAGELRQNDRAETADRLVQVIDQAKEIAGLKVSLK